VSISLCSALCKLKRFHFSQPATMGRVLVTSEIHRIHGPRISYIWPWMQPGVLYSASLASSEMTYNKALITFEKLSTRLCFCSGHIHSCSSIHNIAAAPDFLNNRQNFRLGKILANHIASLRYSRTSDSVSQVCKTSRWSWFKDIRDISSKVIANCGLHSTSFFFHSQLTWQNRVIHWVKCFS